MSRVQDKARRKPQSSTSSNNGRRGPQLSSWKRSFTDENNDNDEVFDEQTQCVICAEKIRIAALSPCNHTTCHKCTFRQRALYDKKACLVCRTENQKLVFTEELGKLIDDFKSSDLPYSSDEYGIAFTSKYAQDDTIEMLAFRCQICREKCDDFKNLSEHVRGHEKNICTICSANKKAFPYELKVFTQKQLQNHQIRGDEKGFGGHPLCPFCKGRRFYSDDELKLHLRDSHEKCFVCDQIRPGDPQFFKNYESLEEHFKADHFVCKVQSCLDQKFVVFAEDLDLQAHMITTHGGVFPNGYVVGLGPSSSTNGRFQSQLSTFRSPTAAGSSSSTSASSSQNAGNNNDSMETKRLRFEERARHYLNYDASAFKKFTDLNNSFRNGRIDCFGLKASYEEIFKGTKESEIYLLIYDFAQLFSKNSTQSNELTSFVNKHEQKAQEEQNFPALPGHAASLGNYGTWGGKGVATKAQKSAMNEAFPALPTASSVPKYTPVKRSVTYKTVLQRPNGGKAQTVRVNQERSNYVPNYLSGSSSAPVSTSNSSSALRRNAKLDEDSFPELPKPAPKKPIPRVNPVPQGNGVWDSRGNSASSSASNSSLNMGSMAQTLPDGTTVVTKGKGKKKKQILFSI